MPTPANLDRRMTFTVVMLIMVLGTVITAGTVSWRLRKEAIARQFDSANLTVRAFEDQLTNSLNVVDRTLLIAGRNENADLQLFLQQAPYLRSLALLEPSGRIIASSNSKNNGGSLSLADYLPQTPNPAEMLKTGELSVGRDFYDALPVASGNVLPDLSFIPVARDVALSDGQWRTAVAALNTDFFLNFYSSHLAPTLGVVELRRYDGRLLVSTNPGARLDSLNHSQGILQHLARTEAGHFEETLFDDNSSKEVLTAYRASRTYPLVLVVRLDKAQALASWQREAMRTLWLGGGMLLIMLALAIRYFLRFERLAKARERDDANLRIAAAAFEMQDGIFITDPQGVIVRVNRAFTEITGYSSVETIGKTPRLFSSGKHDADFYQALWQRLAQSGVWHGEIWNRRKSGEVYPEWLTITAVKNAAQQTTHYVATLTDITSRKEAEGEIRNLAFYDALSGLPNRRLLIDRLQQTLEQCMSNGHEGALLFIDLDNFKALNDAFGHDMGDVLLQQAAQRLSHCVRDIDTVARLGGDEFVVLLPELSKVAQEAADQARLVGEHIREQLNQVYDLAGNEYRCSVGIGIALFADAQRQSEDLMKRADMALRSAKAEGRNVMRFFDPHMQQAMLMRARLENDLRKAQQQGQLLLYYQAQVGHEGRITGAEVLLRWAHPQLGIISPLDFIPLAEETGLIVPIGLWLLECACQQLATWRHDPACSALTLAVNVSMRQLRQPDFVGQVADIVARSGIAPERLKLELTESVLLEDAEITIAKMSALRARGVCFSLDDFGTGYSSLAYLKRLPLDVLKIDQSFVHDVLSDANDAAIVSTIIALGNSLGLTVLAEGVETEAQREFLAQSGCYHYQGYLFSEPVPVLAFEQLLPGSWQMLPLRQPA